MSERLQKVLARGGLGSRRKCEELIAARRVRVNGEVAAEPGIKVDPLNDEVTIDGIPVESERAVYFLLNKPKGFVCTNRPRPDEQAAVSLIQPPEGQRLFSVGRLDEESTGALIITNDGAFANLLAHPRYGVPKTYRVTVRGKAEREVLDRIRTGVHLAEGRTAPAMVHVVKRSREWSVLRLTLHEGKNRHLRRVFAKIGLPVKELVRVAVGSVRLGRLKVGEARLLTADELEALRAEVAANEKSPRRPSPRPPLTRAEPSTSAPRATKRPTTKKAATRKPNGKKPTGKRSTTAKRGPGASRSAPPRPGGTTRSNARRPKKRPPGRG